MIKFLKKIFRKLFLKPLDYPLRKGNRKDFIFIHINKTAGTSISKAIGLQDKNHLTSKEVIDQIGEKKYAEAYKFAVVRNPWSKVVSHYKYRVKTNQSNLNDENISFNDWVKVTYGKNKDPRYYNNPKMFLPQVDWLKDYNEKISVDKIIKFEDLNNEFKKIAKEIGITNSLPHLNPTKKEDYKSFYNTESIEIIKDWFKEDINLFNYRFDE